MARSTPASAPLDLPAAEAGVMLERGRGLIEAGDASGLQALAPAVAALADEHRRLWVLLGLIERALTQPTGEPAERVPGLAVLAALAIDVLEQEPREPDLLLATARLFDLLGMTAVGGALAGSARALGPELMSVGGGLAAARRSPLLAPEMGELADRALEVAACARPALGQRLSLCMIVRDEQEALPRCLRSVAGLMDEIVVLDTGSRDRTIEIARSFGARVIEGAWAGSFALARNQSLEAATGDWIVFLDADEALADGDGERLRALTGRTWCEGFQLSVINHTGRSQDGTSVTHSALRMFRNRPHYRFDGRLHEQLAHRLPGFLPGRIRESNVRIEHFGYLRAVRERRGKSARNLELLRLQQAEGAQDAFLHFNLGSEHAAAGDHEVAAAELERSWALLQERPDAGRGFEAALIKRLVGALRACGRHEEAIAHAIEGLDRFPGFTDLLFEQAMASVAVGREEEALELLERCLQTGEPFSPYPSTAGCGSYLALVELAALQRRRGEPECALELLERCLREHPRHAGSLAPYIEARIADGAGGADIAASLHELLGEMPGHARVTLAERLLARHRYGEAKAALEGLPAEDPSALAAARVELFVASAAADPVEPRDAIERAQMGGMRAWEIDLFKAWRRLALGASTEVRPSLVAVPRLLEMLETLLVAQDFKGFEVLHGLLFRSLLCERERRELLAEMYLRTGFLASAAEEWMGVCDVPGDARALLGLARVALARGMVREADDFATAALERDPTSEGAAALLSQLQPVST